MMKAEAQLKMKPPGAQGGTGNGESGDGESDGAEDASFNESDHPRDDDGKWTGGGAANPSFGTNKKANVQEAIASVQRAGYNAKEWKPTSKTVSAAVFSNGAIHINSSHKFWSDPVGNMKNQAGHLSSEHPAHILNHEIGHALYDPPDNFMTLSHQDMAREQVSQYAARNRPRRRATAPRYRARLGSQAASGWGRARR